MTRNWDAEWQEVSAAQAEAFRELRQAMTVVTGMFLGRGGPSVEQREQAESAETAWAESTRRVEGWLEEWRAAHARRT
jgi:hypothetical protein